MTSVGVFDGNFVGLSTHEAQNKLRERRNKAVERIKILGFTQLVLSIMAIAVGIGTLIVASREPMGFPVFNPGPIIAGFLVLVLAGLEMLAWRTGESCHNDIDTPSGLKCMWMAVYILGLIWLVPCHICAGACILSIVRCTAQATDTIGIYCYPDKTINITLAAIGTVICGVLAVTCILNCVFFCVYARAFGYKSRNEQAIEYYNNMMIMQQQQKQQQLQDQGQYIGQPVQSEKFSSRQYY